MNPVSASLIRPECLVFSAFIVLDHGVCRIKDILRRSVILLQLNDCRIRINLFKIKNIADIGASEFVNGLVIVTHNTQVTASRCQQSNQLELRSVGILILIDHDVLKTVLIVLQNIRAALEKLHSLDDEIIKIKGVIFL